MQHGISLLTVIKVKQIMSRMRSNKRAYGDGLDVLRLTSFVLDQQVISCSLLMWIFTMIPLVHSFHLIISGSSSLFTKQAKGLDCYCCSTFEGYNRVSKAGPRKSEITGKL